MPPADLSTLAVMIPGPTTARNSRVRPLNRFRNLMRAFREHIAEEDERSTRCVAGKEWNEKAHSDKRTCGSEQRKSTERQTKIGSRASRSFRAPPSLP